VVEGQNAFNHSFFMPKMGEAQRKIKQKKYFFEKKLLFLDVDNSINGRGTVLNMEFYSEFYENIEEYFIK
jgi:hypothetical protein